VTYDANGASGSVPTDAQKYQQGAPVTVLGAGSLNCSGCSFAGWTTSTTGTGFSYASGANFMMGLSDVKLYAVWIPNSLKFVSSGWTIAVTGFAAAPSGSLAIPQGVNTVGDFAFQNCSGLTSVTLPPSVIIIGESAFSGTGLTSITIPSSVQVIGEFAFTGSTHLANILVDSASQDFESISGVLFNNAGTVLEAVPGGLSGGYAIPSSVTLINAAAADGCTGLTSITIPASVTSIGNMAFQGCTGLADVYEQAVTPPTLPTGSTAFSQCASGLKIHVPSLPSGTLNIYETTTGWSDYYSPVNHLVSGP